MNRRRFLTLTGTSTGALLVGRGNTATGATSEENPLALARERAQAVGKPLLLIPTAKDVGERMLSTRLWQGLFSTPDDNDLAVLALCEVVFAALPEGQAFDFQADLALLSVPNSDAWQVISHPTDPPTSNRRRTPTDVAALLRSTLVPDKAALKFLDAYTPLTEHWGRSSLQGFRASSFRGVSRVRISTVDRLAAQVWFQMEVSDNTEFKIDATRALATAAALRLYEQDPPGARWEDPPNEDPCPGCGMGFIPFQSRLFLDAYTAK